MEKKGGPMTAELWIPKIASQLINSFLTQYEKVWSRKGNNDKKKGRQGVGLSHQGVNKQSLPKVSGAVRVATKGRLKGFIQLKKFG